MSENRQHQAQLLQRMKSWCRSWPCPAPGHGVWLHAAPAGCVWAAAAGAPNQHQAQDIQVCAYSLRADPSSLSPLAMLNQPAGAGLWTSATCAHTDVAASYLAGDVQLSSLKPGALKRKKHAPPHPHASQEVLMCSYFLLEEGTGITIACARSSAGSLTLMRRRC